MSSSSEPHGRNLVLGFVAAAIAVVGFGSNFVPAKKIYSGNGIFFQWAMCCAVWIVGLCVNVYQGFPKFEPLAMLGGALWCSGNVMAVPIINLIGLAIGMSVWCVANMITGWASGFFGILGVESQRDEINYVTLNIIGVCIAAVSIVLFACIKDEPKDDKKDAASLGDEDSITQPLIEASINSSKKEEEEDTMARCSKKMNPVLRRVIGFVMAVASGVFYGTNFNPPTYLMDHDEDGLHSTNGLDYVFSHFTGIFVTSTLFVVIYCIATCNHPTVYRRSLLPGLASGAIWAVAQVSWFIANDNLSIPIAFPIITSGPAVVATLWGVLLFHEVSGVKHIILLVVALCITISGVVVIALSKFLTSQSSSSAASTAEW